MTSRSYSLKQELLAEYAEIMLMALKNEGGVYPTGAEHEALKEKLMDALNGTIRI